MRSSRYGLKRVEANDGFRWGVLGASVTDSEPKTDDILPVWAGQNYFLRFSTPQVIDMH